MSAYYSKFSLNSYAGTPYFQAHVPEGFPVYLLLQKARAFRRLPPNLKTLARNSRRWAELHDAVPGSIAEWYDAQGYELDPNDGHRLTDAEIDAQWEPDPGLDAVMVTDIPMPPRGFAAPDEWELPEAPVEAGFSHRELSFSGMWLPLGSRPSRRPTASTSVATRSRQAPLECPGIKPRPCSRPAASGSWLPPTLRAWNR